MHTHPVLEQVASESMKHVPEAAQYCSSAGNFFHENVDRSNPQSGPVDVHMRYLRDHVCKLKCYELEVVHKHPHRTILYP